MHGGSGRPVGVFPAAAGKTEHKGAAVRLAAENLTHRTAILGADTPGHGLGQVSLEDRARALEGRYPARVLANDLLIVDGKAHHRHAARAQEREDKQSDEHFDQSEAVLHGARLKTVTWPST